jgi:hypothetical protein
VRPWLPLIRLIQLASASRPHTSQSDCTEEPHTVGTRNSRGHNTREASSTARPVLCSSSSSNTNFQHHHQRARTPPPPPQDVSAEQLAREAAETGATDDDLLRRFYSPDDEDEEGGDGAAGAADADAWLEDDAGRIEDEEEERRNWEEYKRAQLAGRRAALRPEGDTKPSGALRSGQKKPDTARPRPGRGLGA